MTVSLDDYPGARDTLDGAHLAHLATLLPDGAPHTVPLWIGTSGAHVVFFTGPGSRKARNLQRDPRVALSVVPDGDGSRQVVVRGRVVEWVDGADGWALVDDIAGKYTGGQPYPREYERIAALIEPEHVRVGIG